MHSMPDSVAPGELAARQRSQSAIEALQQERDLAQLYLDIANVILVGIASDQTIMLINKKGCEVLGYEKSDLLGKNWFDTCLPEPMRAQVKDVFDQLMRGAGDLLEYVENAVLTRRGEERLIAWRNTTLHDAAGRIMGTISSGEDVTERRGAERALKRRAAHMTMLNDIGAKVAASLELDEILDRAVHLLHEHFGYHHVAIFTFDSQRSELTMQARAGQFAHLFPPHHHVPLDRGMVGWVGRHGERLLANDVAAEPHYINFYPQVLPTRAELCVPIRVGQQTVGVLDLQSPRTEAFDDQDVVVLEILANQVAVAMGNARLYDQVRTALKERDVLLKEIHHRVKNNLQVVNSLLSLRSEAIREPQARQVFVDCQNSVRSIALIHEKLYQSRNLAHIQADEYIPNLINHLQVTFSHQYYVHLDVQVDSGALDLDTAIPCGLIITELFTNAMKHAFVGREHSPHDVCRLWVEFRVQEGRGSLVIRDNGIGLPEDFDLTRSASLGLQLVALLTQQLRGQLTVTQAGGARFAIEFPLLTPAR